MNKKIIIGIAAGVAALAVVIAAIVMITTGFFKKGGNNSSSAASSGSVSSLTGSDTSSGSSGGSSSSQSAISKGSVSIGTADAKAGDTVSVPIKLSSNPGIGAGLFCFKYDASALTYSSYEEGDILEEYDVNDENGVVKCVISASGTTDVTKNGTLITLKFKVKPDAKKGDYKITVTDETMISNFDEVTVSPKIGDGTVTVK